MRTRAFKVSRGRKCNTQGSDCARGTYTNYMTPQHIPRARKSLQSRTLALKGFIYPDITVPAPFTTTPDRKTPPGPESPFIPLYTPGRACTPRIRAFTPVTCVYQVPASLLWFRLRYTLIFFAIFAYIFKFIFPRFYRYSTSFLRTSLLRGFF